MKISAQEALDYIEQNAQAFGVDASTAKGILLAENFDDKAIPKVIQNPKAYILDGTRVSPKGAQGLMQVMPGTLKGLKEQGFVKNENSLGSWQEQIDAGLAAIQEIRKRTGKNDAKYIGAAYNAGPKGGQAYEEGTQLPAETVNYLTKMELAGIGGSGHAQEWNQGDVRKFEPVERGSGTPGASGTSGIGGGTSQTRTTYDGMAALEDLIRNNGLTVNKLINDISISTEQEIAAHKQTSAAIVVAGDAAAEAARAKGAIEGAAAVTRERILQTLNLDTRAVDNRVATSIAAFEKSEAARKPLEAQIAARQSVGFFDDPLQFLINETILPGEVAKHNALSNQSNSALSTLETVQNIAKNQESIDLAATADMIAKNANAFGNMAVAEANAKVSEYKAKSASATARAATTIASLIRGQTDDEIKLVSMKKIVDNEKSDAAKNAKEQAEEQVLDNDIRRIGSMIGANNASLHSVRRMAKDDQTQWMRRVQKNNIGDDFYEAMTFIKAHGNLNNMQATGSAEIAQLVARLDKNISDAAQLEARRIMQTGGKVPNIEELKRVAANEMELKWFATRGNMLLAERNNPYLVDHGIMATRFTGDYEANVVAKMVRDSYKANTKLNDQQVFSATFDLVRSGSVAPKDAAMMLSEYYGDAIKRNNKSRSYNLIGIPMQDDYKILPAESKLDLNMTNPLQLENFFTRSISRAATAQYMNISLPLGPKPSMKQE